MHTRIPRAEHIGSLRRPDALQCARTAYTAGACTADELRACEDAAVAEAVRLQRDLGLPVITDGELRRAIFYEGVFDRLSGLKDVANAPAYMFQTFNFVQSWPVTRICISKLKRTRPLYGEDFDALKRIAGPENVAKLKVTMGAPEWFHFRHGKYTYEPSAYANDADYFADVARVYREEIQDLYARGCRRIQIDDPVLGCFCDEGFRRRMREASVDPARLLDTYLGVLDACVRGRPAGMAAGVHICRGNVKPDGSSFAQGPYDFIAKALFTKLDVDAFYLEYDTARSGGFEPLRYLPRGKVVVLGLLSTKTPKMEDFFVLKARIMEAADAMTHGDIPRTQKEALAQLSLSPQCGFSSRADVTFVSHEDMVKKLTLVRDVARSVWGSIE